MHSTNQTRLSKEFQSWKSNAEASEIQVSLVDGSFNHWKGLIKGPADTVYAGGLFQIDIIIPPEYPYKPPKMKFDSKIWHPNISSQTGAICLDVLTKEWSPALSIRTALLSIIVLLQAPEPDDPQDAVVAGQYKNDREQFKKTAIEWTKLYASPSVQTDKIKKLCEMGFDQAKVKQVLERHGWDEEAALNELLS